LGLLATATTRPTSARLSTTEVLVFPGIDRGAVDGLNITQDIGNLVNGRLIEAGGNIHR
jgi:hypothetical protein